MERLLILGFVVGLVVELLGEVLRQLLLGAGDRDAEVAAAGGEVAPRITCLGAAGIHVARSWLSTAEEARMPPADVPEAADILGEYPAHASRLLRALVDAGGGRNGARDGCIFLILF